MAFLGSRWRCRARRSAGAVRRARSRRGVRTTRERCERGAWGRSAALALANGGELLRCCSTTTAARSPEKFVARASAYSARLKQVGPSLKLAQQ